jgi:putative nucleotidyltransferase with HDIG domain
MRDPYTFEHCVRVSTLARRLAESHGLSEIEQRIVEFSAVFHDLGKIGIPDSILQKPGKLTESEERIMREHPVKSAEILSSLHQDPFFHSLLPGILHHHERSDGLGYPYGLVEKEIPITARIILVADTFDAMTSTRPYRKQLPDEIAYRELKLFSGRQFDSQIVKTFLQAHPKWDKFGSDELTFAPASIFPLKKSA